MQTITYDPATHVLVPREPTKIMVRTGYEYTGTTQSEVRETYKKMLEVSPASSQSSGPNNSYDCREALKWTAAGFRTLVEIMHPIAESDRFVLDDGTRMSIREILDMANAALETKS